MFLPRGWSCMLKPEQRRLFHKFLILEMAVQSLQRDFSVIENE